MSFETVYSISSAVLLRCKIHIVNAQAEFQGCLLRGVSVSVPLGIWLLPLLSVCYSEAERKEEAKERLEKRLEKRENT